MDSAKGIIRNIIRLNPGIPIALLANQITGQIKIEKSINSNVKDGSSACLEGNNVL